jgi:hypothetical protein
MPPPKHEVQSLIPDSESAPRTPPTGPDLPLLVDDDQPTSVETPNSAKAEKSGWAPMATPKRAIQAPRGGILQLVKSLLLPVVGEDFRSERPSGSNFVPQPSHILLFATLCTIGWFPLPAMASSILRHRTCVG